MKKRIPNGVLKYCLVNINISFWFPPTLIQVLSSPQLNTIHKQFLSTIYKSEMNDSADMNLNHIPLLETHSGDVNTGKHNLLLQQLHISPSKLTTWTLVRELPRWTAIYTYIWRFHDRGGWWPGQFRLRLIYFHFHFFFTSRSTTAHHSTLNLKLEITNRTR